MIKDANREVLLLVFGCKLPYDCSTNKNGEKSRDGFNDKIYQYDNSYTTASNRKSYAGCISTTTLINSIIWNNLTYLVTWCNIVFMIYVLFSDPALTFINPFLGNGESYVIDQILLTQWLITLEQHYQWSGYPVAHRKMEVVY